MNTALTIFAIITGTASLLSFLYPFFRDPARSYRLWAIFGMGAAALWSAYVLFFPGSPVEQNVGAKFALFRNPSVERESATLLVQRGELSFGGWGPFAVEFPLPFRASPDVEILNINGFPESKIPTIEKISAHQFVVKRGSIGGTFTPESLQKFRWVARGEPLEELKSTK